MINVNRARIFLIPFYNQVGVIPICRVFAPKFFNFGIIFALSIFENVESFKVFHKVFTITSHCDMPRRDPYEQVKYAAVTQPGPGNLWVWDSGGSQWVHSNFFIRLPPKINTHFVTTSPTTRGVSQSLFPCLSMEALAWLDSAMILFTSRALHIASSFDPIFVTDNKRCSIIVRLVSAD